MLGVAGRARIASGVQIRNTRVIATTGIKTAGNLSVAGETLHFSSITAQRMTTRTPEEAVQ